MHDPLFVGVLEGFGHLDQVGQQFRRPLAGKAADISSREILHGQEGPVTVVDEIENSHDSRMVQPSTDLALTSQPAAHLRVGTGRGHFGYQVFAGVAIFNQPYLTHAAFAKVAKGCVPGTEVWAFGHGAGSAFSWGGSLAGLLGTVGVRGQSGFGGVDLLEKLPPRLILLLDRTGESDCVAFDFHHQGLDLGVE